MTMNAVSGGHFADIITWVRRLIKTPSTQAISDLTIGDYINRFYLYDVPERIQILELKKQYTFETIPNQFEYQAPFTQAVSANWPLNNNPPPFINNPASPSLAQPQTIMPVYNMFQPPAYVDGIQIGWYQSNDLFYKLYPELVLNEMPIQGNSTTGPYTINYGRTPFLQGFIDQLGNLEPYVYITAQNQYGQIQYIVDSGYLNSSGLGILIQTDSTFQNIIGNPLVGSPPSSGGSGTVDYINGVAKFSFIDPINDGVNIETQTSPYSAGYPRICLYFNNIFKLYPVPDRTYKFQCDAYMTPVVFFNSANFVPFAYMSEYLALGAARKILSDTGDSEQLAFYEPRFREQENLVLRRSDRQRLTERTPTIFSSQTSNNPWLYTQY